MLSWHQDYRKDISGIEISDGLVNLLTYDYIAEQLVLHYWTVIWAEEAVPLHCSWNQLGSQATPHHHQVSLIKVNVILG